MVALKDSVLELVEVKLTEFDSQGYPVCDLNNKAGKFDRLAIVTHKGEVRY